MNFRIPLTVVIVALTLFSCKKDDFPTTNGKLLHKIINRWHDSLYYTTLKYDMQEKLVEIKATSNNRPLDTSTLTISYDSQNKLIGYTYAQDQRFQIQSFVFTYDSDGHIISKVNVGTNVRSQVYSYDKTGRLIADSVFDKRANSIILKTTFKYDDKNNLIEWQDYYYNIYSKKVENWPVNEVSHHNSINPYTNLGLTLFMITDDTHMLSKNNISEVHYNGTIRKYDYEYESNGLPKKITFNNDHEHYQEFYYE